MSEGIDLDFEGMLISQLLLSGALIDKVADKLEPEWFKDSANREIFTNLVDLTNQYGKLPHISTVAMHIKDNIKNPAVVKRTSDLLKEYNAKPIQDHEYIVDRTETWARESAFYSAIELAIQSADTNTNVTTDQVIAAMTNASTLDFSVDLGHDYFADAAKRYDMIKTKVNKLEFTLGILNDITNGGIERKTYNQILAGTNVGKTLIMTNLALDYTMQGLNVLYISLEMDAEKLGINIDARNTSTSISDVEHIEKAKYLDILENLGSSTQGKLKIKQFPSASKNVNHFRALCRELKLHENFVPDVVFIDYIGLMTSTRIAASSGTNAYYKAISEELRGWAIEDNIALWSASQTNRGGRNSANIELTDASESIGQYDAADFVLGAMRTPELDLQGALLMKQLKSRYGDKSKRTMFLLGCEFEKYSIYEIDNTDFEREQGTVEVDLDARDKEKFGSLII